jgi:chromosome segregation ATPase
MAEYKANAESSEQIVQLAASKIERLEAIIVQSDAAGEALRCELQEARDNLKRSQILLGDWQGNVHGFESETVSASKIIAHLHDQVSVMHKQIAQHIADKSALEARLKVMNDIHHEGQEQLETIKRGLAFDRQEISSLQECNAKLGRALDNSNQAHHQMQSALEIIGDKFFTLVQKLSDSLYHTSTDNVYLNSEVSRLESEYEEEQQLSSMLQTQVQTLHAVVT